MKGMVSKGNFEKILFYKPPAPLQERFSSFFQQHIEMINKLELLKRNGDNLFKSLSQRAFQGEL